MKGRGVKGEWAPRHGPLLTGHGRAADRGARDCRIIVAITLSVIPMKLRLLAACVLGALAAALWPASAAAQPSSYARFYDQRALEDLLYAHESELEDIPEMSYRYHVLDHPSGNSIWARHELYAELGGGDTRRGRELLPILEFLNRIRVERLAIGDTLVVPSRLEVDFRAFAPFPLTYPGAAELDKLAIIDLGAQAWAAYEHGRLARWGLVVTGRRGYETPGGRYNFNWRARERVSSESPPGETWLMRWVLNFHAERGFHTHQYSMPTSGPASHGCVRMIDADARWLYGWVEPWVTTAGRGALGGEIRKQGTMLLVLGEGQEPEGPAQRFDLAPEGPVLRVVELPEDPWSVPPGTAQQRAFDRLRRARS